MIDTNILLDWLLDRDPSRTKRIEALFSSVHELHIPDVIIVELVFALEKIYTLPRQIIVNNIMKILDDPFFNCNRILFHKAISDYVDHPSWSFVDSCLIHYADLQHIIPVWTFDKKMVVQSDGIAKSPA